MPLVHKSKKKKTINRYGRTFVTHLTQLDKSQINTLLQLYHHFGEDVQEITTQMNMTYMDQCHQLCRIKHFLTKIIHAPIYDDEKFTPDELHRIFSIVLLGIQTKEVKNIWRHVKDEFPMKRTIKEKLQQNFSTILFGFAASNFDVRELEDNKKYFKSMFYLNFKVYACIFSLAIWPAENTPVMKDISESAKLIANLIKVSIEGGMNITRSQSKYDSILNIYKNMPSVEFNVTKFKQAIEILYLIDLRTNSRRSTEPIPAINGVC